MNLNKWTSLFLRLVKFPMKIFSFVLHSKVRKPLLIAPLVIVLLVSCGQTKSVETVTPIKQNELPLGIIPQPTPDKKHKEPIVTTKEEIKLEVIPFNTVNLEDSSILKGKTLVKTKGSNGEKKTTYIVTYTDNKESSRVVKSTVNTKEPIDRVILNGTKEKVVTQPKPTTNPNPVTIPNPVITPKPSTSTKPAPNRDISKVDTNGNGIVTIKEAKAAGYKMPIYKDHWLYPYMKDADNDGKVGEGN